MLVTVASDPRFTVRIGDPHEHVGFYPKNISVSAEKISSQEVG